MELGMSKKSIQRRLISRNPTDLSVILRQLPSPQPILEHVLSPVSALKVEPNPSLTRHDFGAAVPRTALPDVHRPEFSDRRTVLAAHGHGCDRRVHGSVH